MPGTLIKGFDPEDLTADPYAVASAENQADYEVGDAVVTVTSTTGNLIALLAAATPAAALPAGVVNVFLQNIGGVIVTRIAITVAGAVAGAGHRLGVNDSASIDTTKALADAWELITAVEDCDVYVSWSVPRS